MLMSHRYLILGLLAETPMTGYDIKKRVETILNDVTSASYGTLYPTLHKLHQEGAIDVDEVTQHGRPTKKICAITPKGKQALDQWLQEPAAADQIRREFLLKIYLAADLSWQKLQPLIVTRRDEVTQRMHALRAQRHQLDNPRHIWVVDYILRQYQTEIDWLDQIEAT
jgi:PadR family transcriptional regulator, regulatory protein AphA